MSRSEQNNRPHKKAIRAEVQRVDNSLSDLVSTVRTANLLTGGSNLSSYGTMAWSTNYSLVTLNRIVLTYFYTTSGLFQTAVQLPIQDALSRSIEIESGQLSQDDIDTVLRLWEDFGIWEKLLDMATWARLYGGGAILINTNQDPKTPLNLKTISRGPLELYDLDRWQLDTNVAYFDDYEGIFESSIKSPYFYLWGEAIHESRFLRMKGKRAPSYVRRQLRGWGMSEGERMIRELNLYMKTQDVLYEILDESKLDVYHIKNLAQHLLTAAGTGLITQRVQAANELKNYLNALVLDKDEDFEQKTMTFSGLAEVSRENRIGVAASLRMPVTKLFGISAAGFNAGEDDLESYNQMVESEIRAPLKQPIRQLLDLTFMYQFGFIPEYRFKFPPMRVLTEQETEEIKDRRANRLLAFYDRGLLLSQEVGAEARKAGIFTLPNKMEEGQLPPQPIPPNGPETVAPFAIPSAKPVTNKKLIKK